MRCLAQVRVDTTRSFVQFRPVDLGRWKAIVSGQLTEAEARTNPDGFRLLLWTMATLAWDGKTGNTKIRKRPKYAEIPANTQPTRRERRENFRTGLRVSAEMFDDICSYRIREYASDPDTQQHSTIPHRRVRLLRIDQLAYIKSGLPARSAKIYALQNARKLCFE